MKRLVLLLLLTFSIIGAYLIWAQIAHLPTDPLPPHLVSGVFVFHALPMSDKPGQWDPINSHIANSHIALDLWNLKHVVLPMSYLIAHDGSWAIVGGRGGKYRLISTSPTKTISPLATREWLSFYQPLYSGSVSPTGLAGAIVKVPPYNVDSLFAFGDPRASSLRKHALPGLALKRAKWCLGSTPDHAIIQTDDARLVRLDLETGHLVLDYGRGRYPCVSPRGDLAFTTVNEQGIRIVRADGSTTTYRGPGTRIFYLQWTPDGAGLLYSYANEGWKMGIGASASDVWAVGFFDARTDHHYRVLPARYGGINILGAMRKGQGQCLQSLPPGLVELLRQAKREDESKDKRK